MSNSNKLIAMISDTHDNTPAIVWIIKYLNGREIPVAFHAGDMINPGILFRFRDHYKGHLHFVFGNNDGERAIAVERTNKALNLTCHLDSMRLEYKGKKIYMHHYSDTSESVAKSGDVDIAIGGHDHLYRVTNYDRGIFVNPGNTVTKDEWLPQEPDKESSIVIFDLETMKHGRILLPQEFQWKSSLGT